MGNNGEAQILPGLSSHVTPVSLSKNAVVISLKVHSWISSKNVVVMVEIVDIA